MNAGWQATRNITYLNNPVDSTWLPHPTNLFDFYPSFQEDSLLKILSISRRASVLIDLIFSPFLPRIMTFCPLRPPK